MRLLSLIYGSATEAEFHVHLLQELQSTFKSQQATLIDYDCRCQHNRMLALGIEPAMRQQYENHFGAMDEWANRGRSQPSGFLCDGDMTWPEEEMLKSEFYSDFLRPLKMHHLMGAIILNTPNRMVTTSFLQSPTTGPFRKRDLILLNTLVPHFQTAAQLAERLATLEQKSRSLETLLNHRVTGVLLLNEMGLVLFSNQAADRLVSAEDGIRLRAGKLEIFPPACSVLYANA